MPRVLHFSAILFHSVDYFSDESSSSTASGNAGDSSYCPTSDSCESETVIKEGPVLGSIVIHPAIYRASYRQFSCKEPPESVGLCSVE